jgi:hypothetical protein
MRFGNEGPATQRYLIHFRRVAKIGDQKKAV